MRTDEKAQPLECLIVRDEERGERRSSQFLSLRGRQNRGEERREIEVWESRFQRVCWGHERSRDEIDEGVIDVD